MTEAALQRKCITFAQNQEVICHKVDSASSRGWPDLTLVFPGGKFILVELKHPNGGGRLNALQVVMIKRLANQGATVHVIDSFDDFRDMVLLELNL